MGANQLLNCLLARKPKPAHRAALQLWCPCGVGSSSAPTRPSLFCAPIQAVRVAPQGSCVGFVPVCAGTCAGSIPLRGWRAWAGPSEDPKGREAAGSPRLVAPVLPPPAKNGFAPSENAFQSTAGPVLLCAFRDVAEIEEKRSSTRVAVQSGRLLGAGRGPGANGRGLIATPCPARVPGIVGGYRQ